MKRLEKTIVVFSLCILLLIIGSASIQAQGQKAAGQTVYVPVYSHIYSGNKERPFNLAVTLSIRNTDPAGSIRLEAVDYFDSAGKLVRHYLDKEVVLAPMATTRYVVKESDTSGGSGANFIVRWQADEPVNSPLIESIMIGTQSQQGISFTSRGQVLYE